MAEDKDKKNQKSLQEMIEKHLKDAEKSTADLSGRVSRLYSATSDLDSTVLGFQELSKNTSALNGSLKPYASAFKDSLSSIEKSKVAVFESAQSMVESNQQALSNMAGWSERSKFVLSEIAMIGEKALTADASEARNLRKDLTSMRSAANLLTGEQRETALAQISQGEKALEKFSGKWGIVSEAFSKKFNAADMVEKMLGGGAIGGMVGSMMKISAERKKVQKMRDMKAANMSFDKDEKGRTVSDADVRSSKFGKEGSVGGEIDPTLSPIEKQVGLLERISTSVRASLNIQSSETVSAIEEEEAKREGGEQDAQTMSQKIIGSAGAFAGQIRSFLWDGLIVPFGLFIWKIVIKPFGMLLKKIFWDSLIKPLIAWSAKHIAASKVGKAVGGAFGKIKDKWSAAAGAGKGGGLMGAAKGVTDKAGSATKAAPKKGVLKRIADGIKEFGNKKVLRGAINIGILALSLIPLAISLKMFSSVSFGGVVAFAASLTVLVVAVRVLAEMKSQVIQGAFAIGILSLAMIPLAIGLNLMKGVGIGTIIVLAGALLVLGVAANIFGSMAANPFFWLGILAIAALGVALLPLAIAMKIAAEAFEIFLGSLDIEKMMMLGPMLFFAAPGLLAFGLAAFFAAPGLIMLAIAATLLTNAKASETLPPMLEAFAEFSERVNPMRLIAASAGILAVGGALLGFAIAGVAASAIATAGNVVGNLMTLGGLLGAPAPGPFDMLKMFIAFGNLSGQLKEGASAIEEIQASMMKFALMDTEGMKDGVQAMVSAIDEFTWVLFRAKMFGGIGDTLLGGDPLESFIKLSESGSGIAAAAEGIKKLGETFVWFSGQKQHMAAFRSGIFTESLFENMMEDLTAGLDELDIEQFEEKIALMERLGIAIQNLTKSGSEFATKGGVDLKGIGSGDLKSMGSGQVSSDEALGIRGMGNSGQSDSPDDEDTGGMSKKEERLLQLERGKEILEKRLENQLARGPIRDTADSIKFQEHRIKTTESLLAQNAELISALRNGPQIESKEESNKEGMDEALGISSEMKKNTQEIVELQEYMKGDEEFFGKTFDADKERLAELEKHEVILRARLLEQQTRGPRTTSGPNAAASLRFQEQRLSKTEQLLAENAVMQSQLNATGGGGSMNAPIIANKTVNNQQSDTVIASSAITVNPESSLRASDRNNKDDDIL